MQTTRNKCLAVFLILLMLSVTAYAAPSEDKLKPFVERFYDFIKAIVNWFVQRIYGIFPPLESSVARENELMQKYMPFLAPYMWIFYLAAFFAIMAILAKLWVMSKRYIYNSIIGIIILLILVHVLGVQIKLSIITLGLIAIFGVPGVILVVILHYAGIVF